MWWSWMCLATGTYSLDDNGIGYLGLGRLPARRLVGHEARDGGGWGARAWPGEVAPLLGMQAKPKRCRPRMSCGGDLSGRKGR
ncbi:Os12g0188851 [Oryza sativa Japonica Group]|uniref:Os12g0188851 protein n=1 Tax=Oryza sativa subsp. japonica TaxID=39947 RepID=A0A0P0Y7Y4_ORYSJ|nr:Os12g0188851 [Oryza sativa Japonica Group]